MEGAAVNGRTRLLGQNRATGLVAADDGFRRLARLAGREAAVPGREGLAAPDQQIDAATAVLGAQADVVGGALVGQMGDGGQGVMDGELGRVGEEGVQRALGLLML